MFCPNCGSQLPDEAAFCGNCGTRLNPQPQPEADPVAPAQTYAPYYAPMGEGEAQPAPKKRNPAALIGIVAAVVSVAILLICLLGGGGSGSPEGVVEKFFDAVLSGDISDAEDCVHPDMWEDIAGGFEEVESMMAMLGDGITIDVKGSENVTSDEKEDVQDILEDYGIDEKLGDIYEVEVAMTINFMGMEQTDTNDMLVAEVGGTYYIVDAG